MGKVKDALRTEALVREADADTIGDHVIMP